MVTTKGRPTASRSTSKSKASSRSGSRTASRSKAPASKGRASHAASRSGGRSGGRATATRSAESGLFSDHAADLWAIGLATLGILLALALYGEAAGTVGHGVDVALGAVVG